MWRDTLLAWRRLVAAPMFILLSVSTLALGIGSTIAVYSALRFLFGPPPGVLGFSQVIIVEAAAEPSWRNFRALASERQLFGAVTAWLPFATLASADGYGGPVLGELVAGNYFAFLGVTPQLGRLLVNDDDQEGAEPVVVLSDGFWRRAFGAAPDVIGREVRIAGARYQVVGVAHREFRGMVGNGLRLSALWIPARVGGALLARVNASPGYRVQVRAKLTPGQSLAHAAAALEAIASHPSSSLWTAPGRWSRQGWPAFQLTPATERYLDASTDRIAVPLSWATLLASWLVLAVCAANLAGLMLAHASTRRHEMAVKLALGAPRWRLVRGMLIEAATVGTASGIAAIWMAKVVATLLTGEVDVIGYAASLYFAPVVDFPVMLLGAVATVFAVCVIGVPPALSATRGDVRSVLSSGYAAGAGPTWSGRRRLIAGQVAVSAALVGLAVLFVSLVGERRRGTSMSIGNVAVLDIDFASQRYSEAQARHVLTSSVERIRTIKGVSQVAISSGLPGLLSGLPAGVWTSTASEQLGIRIFQATPGFFGLLDIALKQGRVFSDLDTPSSPRVIVLDVSTSRELFGVESPIGRPVTVRSSVMETTATVIGIVADVDQAQAARHTLRAVYLSFGQRAPERVFVMARANGDARRVTADMRARVQEVDPALAVTRAADIATLTGDRDLFHGSVGALAGILGALALAVSTVGLYGTLSHVIKNRSREIGIRLALGAGRSRIVWMVLRQGLRPVASGLMVGLLLALVGRLVIPVFGSLNLAYSALVFLILVPTAFAVAGVAACIVPAWRAATVHPNIALRDL